MAPDKPRVIIVGAGIGGLVLAILMEKASIPYEILERATEVKMLGNLLCLLGLRSWADSLYCWASVDVFFIPTLTPGHNRLRYLARVDSRSPF